MDYWKKFEFFLHEKSKRFDELYDEEWITDFAFFVDLSGHLNDLNLNLQGEGRLVTQMYDSVQGFSRKLQLWIDQIESGNFAHFPLLSERREHALSRCLTYKRVLTDLNLEFEERFADFKEIEPRMQLFSSPFTVDVATTSSALQMELIDLKCSTDLKNKFDGTDLARFYRYLPVAKYPGLHENAIQMLSVFGSTYICEQYFSRMKAIKSETRSRLTQVHLTSTSRIATTSLKVNLRDLVRSKPRCIVSTLANK